MMATDKKLYLYDYDSHEQIREATPEEARLSAEDAYGPDGLILVDWRSEGGWRGENYRRCYVIEEKATSAAP